MPVQRPDGIDSRVRSAANRCLRERRYKLVGSLDVGSFARIRNNTRRYRLESAWLERSRLPDTTGSMARDTARALSESRTIRSEQALTDAMAFIVTHPFTRRSQAATNWTTLFAQFDQLPPRVLIARIQLDRSRICHKRSLDIVRRFVTVPKAVPCIRGIGIGLCVQFEQHDG